MTVNKDDIKADMLSKVGTEIAVTDWVLVDQQRIQDFADATLDQQWIHTNPEMAAKGPFGGPIAHGLLTFIMDGVTRECFGRETDLERLLFSAERFNETALHRWCGIRRTEVHAFAGVKEGCGVAHGAGEKTVNGHTTPPFTA